MSDLVGGDFLITPLHTQPAGIVEMRITGKDFMIPLALDPPSAVGYQQWTVEKAEDVKDTYVITPLGRPKEGFSWVGEIPKPGSPVFFGEPRPLFLTKVEDGPPFTYRIQPGIIIVGATYYVGHDGNHVQFVDYPVTDTPQPEAPMWRFIPILK
ncbi:hypothetical protein BD779DRAFT_1804465 [Infundibulicybe gibba]|nr:hypothetical protein BD779DRAFT_1804465 [Infundibulicybe gibba]